MGDCIPDKRMSNQIPQGRQADIEPTPAMIEAGKWALAACAESGEDFGVWSRRLFYDFLRLREEPEEIIAKYRQMLHDIRQLPGGNCLPLDL